MMETKPVSLRQLVLYFLRLGAFGFGGPIALAGYMQRDLIARRWITDEEYLEGLAFSQMMPGPLAAQLAMWIGYIRHGALGASLTGIVFVLPTYLIVLGISALHVAYHGLSLGAGEERILSWTPQLESGSYTIEAKLIYDLNRYNERSFTGDQTEIYRASLPVAVGERK
jgi:hypothetical protein